MKTILALIVLCLVLTLPTEAQLPNQAKLDSLLMELEEKPQTDTTRAKLMLRVGFELLNIGMMDSARVWLDQALSVAKASGSDYYMAKILSTYGVTYFYSGQTAEAQTYWKQAYEIAEPLGDDMLLAKIRVNLANAEQAFGNYPAALDLYLKVLAGFEAINDLQSMGMTYGNVGVLYASMDDSEKAITYFRKALVIDSAQGFNDQYLFDLTNLGNTLVMDKKYEEAEQYLQRALELSRKMNNPRYISQSLTLMANLHMEQFHLSEAIKAITEANAILRPMGDEYTLAVNRGRMAVIYIDMVKPEHKAELDQFFGGDRQKALDAALTNIDSALTVLEQSGDLAGLKVAYQTLSSIYEGKGNYLKAYESHTRFKMLSDSLLNMERDKKVTQTAMQYEFDKQQAMEQAQQEKKDARQATIRNSIASVLGGSLIFLFVVVRQRNRIKVEKKRSDDLLLNILPEEVADELKAKGTADAKHFDRATILFTDFKNFTQMSEKMSPAELVEELNKCFKFFDEVMVKYKIEKIKTIGDAYMAAGGLPDKQHGSPADVIKAALRMQEFMERHKAERLANGKPFFEMRCGIHTGPVVAGIVGVKKFQYDIWGDTVNMASRMESSGEVGQVNISEATYLEVKDTPGLVFQHRGKVAAKGKGDVDMWFVREA